MAERHRLKETACFLPDSCGRSLVGNDVHHRPGASKHPWSRARPTRTRGVWVSIEKNEQPRAPSRKKVPHDGTHDRSAYSRRSAMRFSITENTTFRKYTLQQVLTNLGRGILATSKTLSARRTCPGDSRRSEAGAFRGDPNENMNERTHVYRRSN